MNDKRVAVTREEQRNPLDPIGLNILTIFIKMMSVSELKSDQVIFRYDIVFCSHVGFSGRLKFIEN